MGLFLIALGSTFVWYLWASWQRAKEMDVWEPVTAEVMSSEIQNWQYSEISKVAFMPVIEYHFSYQGQDFVSTQLRRMPVRSSELEKAESWTEKYPVGAQPTAYVNPADPSQSVLKRETKAAVYTIWFPMLFVVGGIGMVLSAILPKLEFPLVHRRKKNT